MKEDENLDEIIRRKTDSRTFGFSENSWIAVQAKIAAQQRSRRRRRFWFGGLSLLLLPGAWLLWMNSLSPENKPALTERGTVQSPAGSGQEPEGQPGTTNTQAAAAGEPSSPAPGKEKNHPAGENTNAVREAATARSGDPTAAKTAAGTGPGVPARPRTEKNSAPVRERPGSKPGPGQNDSPGTGAAANPAMTAGSATEKIPGTSAPEPEQAASGENSGNSIATETAGATAVRDSSASTPQPLASANAPKTDSSSRTTQENSPDDLSVPAAAGNAPGSCFFVQAGLQYMPGFTSSSSVGRSINPVASAGLSLGLGERIRLESGLQYSFLGKASDSSRVYSNTSYSFGVDISKTEIGLRRLHYLSAPFSLRFQLNPDHAFLGTFTPSYMFTTESKVRTYDQTGSTITNEKIKTAFGYNYGINRFDVLVGAGYSRRFGSRFEGIISFHQGLLDIKNPEGSPVTLLTAKETNKHLQLVLRYNF